MSTENHTVKKNHSRLLALLILGLLVATLNNTAHAEDSAVLFETAILNNDIDTVNDLLDNGVSIDIR
jgi:hypothetical protein